MGIDEKKSDNESEKVLFIKRFFAFVIDLMLVTLCATFIAVPFINTDNINELRDEYLEIQNSIDYNKIEESYDSLIDINYRLSKAEGILTLGIVVIDILYFVVYQIYNNGQTIGKKLMKIKVISSNDELTMNQMIFRVFLANSLLLDIITLIFMIFSEKYLFFYGVILFSIIQYFITFVSILMVMFSKNSLALHDILFHTKVVNE